MAGRSCITAGLGIFHWTDAYRLSRDENFEDTM